MAAHVRSAAEVVSLHRRTLQPEPVARPFAVVEYDTCSPERLHRRLAWLPALHV